MGTSRHWANHAASTRAKSLSAHVKMRLMPASGPYPRSAISQLLDSHCVSGNAQAREVRRVVAFGRPQSPARKNIDRERLDASTLSGSTTIARPAPNKPRFFRTSLPRAPPPTTRNVRFVREARGSRPSAVGDNCGAKLTGACADNRNVTAFMTCRLLPKHFGPSGVLGRGAVYLTCLM